MKFPNAKNTDLSSLGLCVFNNSWKENNKDKLGTDDITLKGYVDAIIKPGKVTKANIELIREIRSLPLEKAKLLFKSYPFYKKVKDSNTVDKIYSIAKWKLGVHVYPSCQFNKEGCKYENVSTVSGLMVYDIQEISNETLTKLRKWNHTVVLHRSVGGGETDFALFLYCPGLDKDTYTSGWNRGRALLKSEFGIEATDTDETKDVTRIRYLSYDKDCYVNYFADPVLLNDLLINTSFTPQAQAAIDKIINSEPEWFRFSVALASVKGEAGREFFHKVSATNQKKYDVRECDEKYTRAIETAQRKKPGKEISAGTFFWYLKRMHISFQFPKNDRAIQDGKETEISVTDLVKKMQAGWHINVLNEELVNIASGRVETEEDIWLHLSEHYDETIPFQYVMNICRSSAVNRFNPLLEYFKSTEWDGVDYIKEYVKALPAVDEKRALAFVKTWLVAAYWQAVENKTNRFLLVYKGTENTGKSKSLEWLCPIDYMLKVGPLETDNKDTRLSMSMFFIWNDDELKASRVADFNKIKALISQATIVERGAYERRQKIRPRICNFVGSTNSEAILLATEENTRFLIVAMQPGKKFDWNRYLKIDKAQFWAQVKELAQSGWRDDVTTMQKAANEESVIVTVVEEFLKATYKKSDGKKIFVTQLREIVVDLQDSGLTNINQHQVRELVTKIFGGLVMGFDRTGVNRVRGYPLIK